MSKKPIVAIVGRPNVGKSTFVNRLLGARESIVDNMPGVTRDRLYFDVEWTGKPFTVIDTGGIIPDLKDEIMTSIYSQVEVATREADVIIFLTDGTEGVTPVDEDIANVLRKTKKPILLAVNKIDTPEKKDLINDFYSLAAGMPFPVSAMHGSGGIGDILDELTSLFPEDITGEESGAIRLAIVGRPNVGKSSLINSLLGQERVIVSDVAGTTRDSINTNVDYEGEEYILVDTAGIRRKSKVEYGIEKFSVIRSLKAIRESDVTVLLVDAVENITDQDKKIAQISNEAGRAIIVAVNKWDLVENKNTWTVNSYTKVIRREAPHLSFAPILYISAMTKKRIHKIFALAKEVYAESTKKVATSILNRVVLEAFLLNPPPSVKNKRLKAYYATQVGVQPPTFALFVNDKSLLIDTYQRYLENKLREAFGFEGTPIKIVFKNKKKK